jgi:hypothetical protein
VKKILWIIAALGIIGTVVLCARINSALADPAEDSPHQPRTLGNKAALSIYYYAPGTLEITYVDTYLFKTRQACVDAIPAALRIAAVYASEGDRLDAQCVEMHPPVPVPSSTSDDVL